MDFLDFDEIGCCLGLVIAAVVIIAILACIGLLFLVFVN
jgi:hypothetical protein